MSRQHWSQVLACSCGQRFRSYAAEAQHRHNFPAMCRQPRRRSKPAAVRGETVTARISLVDFIEKVEK